MTNQEMLAKWGAVCGWSSNDDLETFRKAKAGHFDIEVKDKHGLVRDTERVDNIVTNEGLDYILDAGLSGGTAITAWYVTLSTSNTSETAAQTYAVPVYTEIANAAAGCTNTLRQAWTDGGVTSQSVDNSASAATYTANTSGVTVYGAGLVGGGTAATTLGNTAGGGKLYAYSLFGSSKVLASTDTIDVTYTFTAADDGV